MADLRTDYKDDVLNINTNERRKYRMINNSDGTISFEDVTDYVQNGDSFGSSDLNAITERVNRSLTGADVVDNLESTETKLPLSANMGKELNDKIDEKFARHNILHGVESGTYNVDCTPYTRFSIDFVIANGSVKFPLFIPFISFGSRYRVAYVADVYADVTINADSIVVNILSGSYTGCSVFVYGYK